MSGSSTQKLKDGFASRLGVLVERAGEPKARFASKCGFAPSVLENYLTARSLPGMEALLKLQEGSGVSIEWLVTGYTPTHVAAEPPGKWVRTRMDDPPLLPGAEILDSRLAELIAWLADEWHAYNEHGRARFLVRFDVAFPERRSAPGAVGESGDAPGVPVAGGSLRA